MFGEAALELFDLDYTLARRTTPDSAPTLHSLSGAEVLTRRGDGELLVLVHNKWRLRVIERDHSDLVMEPLLAGGAEADTWALGSRSAATPAAPAL